MSYRSDGGARVRGVARRRWWVHLALIAGFLGAILSAIFLSRKYLGHSGTTDHSIIGLVVLGLILIHLFQRRRTVKSLILRLFGNHAPSSPRSRLAISDTILWLLTLNVMLSGFMDFLVGHTIFIPIALPNVLDKWHLTSVLILVIYVIVHVLRRKGRLRTSHIR